MERAMSQLLQAYENGTLSRRALLQGLALVAVGSAPAEVGPFSLELVHMTHSIPDSSAVALGTDLGGVRLHTGPSSSEAAEALDARAYTLGQDIHFGPNRFDPAQPSGLQLLAHEVAHTQQQKGAVPAAVDQIPVLPSAHRSEADASRAAGLMMHGAPAAVGESIGGAGSTVITSYRFGESSRKLRPSFTSKCTRPVANTWAASGW